MNQVLRSGQMQRAWIAALLLTLLAILLAPAGVARAATITVDTDVDAIAGDGFCSLREAIIAANSNTAVNECSAGAGSDTITITVAGPIALSIAGPGEDAAATGDLDISESLTITSAANVVIDAGGLDRVIHVTDPAVNLILTNIVLQNGAGVNEGAGLFNNGGVVSITGGRIGSPANPNTATRSGGGIYNLAGTVSLDTVIVDGNIASGTLATEGGAGIYSVAGAGQTAWIILDDSMIQRNKANGGAARGGGIYSSAATGGTAIVEATGASLAVNLNEATSGGGLYLSNSYLSMGPDTQVYSNTAATNGGGILAEASTLEFTDAQIGQTGANIATAGDGGGVHITGGTATFNSSVAGRGLRSNTANSGRGGAIYASGAAIHLNGVTEVRSNSAQNGAGLYLDGATTLSVSGTGAGVSFQTNTATVSGGAIYNASTAGQAIRGITMIIDGNEAIDGAGIYNSANTAIELASTRIINNIASDHGGGVYNDGGQFELLRSPLGESGDGNEAQYGGGVYNIGSTATFTMIHAAITHNYARIGGGAYNDAGTLSATFSNNRADDMGAGAYNEGGAAIHGEFFDNELLLSGSRGAGLYNRGTATLWNANGNFGADEGGAVYNEGALTIHGANVDDNVAVDAGGAVYHAAGTLDVENSTLMDNEADSGAGFYLAANATIDHITMAGNTATTAGRAFYLAGGTLTINYSLLLNGSDDCEVSSGTLQGDYNLSSVDADCFNGALNNLGLNTADYWTDPALPFYGTPVAPTLGAGPFNVTDILAGTIASVKDDYDVNVTNRLVNPWQNGGTDPDNNPAIDGAITSTFTVDQRGALRPLDGDRSTATPHDYADIGSYEFGAVVLQDISIPWWTAAEQAPEMTGSYRIMARDIDTVPSNAISVSITTNGQCRITDITGIGSTFAVDGLSGTAVLNYNSVHPAGPAGEAVVELTFTDDDYVEDPLHYCEVTHSNTVSADVYYHNLPVSDLKIGILDDDLPGVTITPLTIGPAVEGAIVGTYDVVLDKSPVPANWTAPGAPAETITITPAFNSTQVSVSPASLSFNSTNWNVAQKITVTALVDNVNEGDLHATVIQHSLSSSATNSPWAGTGVDSVTAQITDIPVVPGAAQTGSDTTSAGGAASGSPILLNISRSTQSVRVGDTLIWFFEITNITSAPTAELTFTASFPDGLSIITAGTTQGTISTTPPLVTARLGVLQPGQTVRISVTTTVNPLTAFLMRGKLARLALQNANLCVSATVSGAMPGLPVTGTSCATVLPISLPETGGQPAEPLPWYWFAVGAALALIAGLALTRRMAQAR